MHEIPRLGHELLAVLDVEIAITEERFMQCQHQHPPFERAPDRCETRRRDLLKDRHQKPKCPALISLAACEVKTVLQIFAELLVELALLVSHHKRLRMHPTPREEWRAIWLAGVRLCPAKHHCIEPMPVFHHLLRC